MHSPVIHFQQTQVFRSRRLTLGIPQIFKALVLEMWAVSHPRNFLIHRKTTLAFHQCQKQWPVVAAERPGEGLGPRMRWEASGLKTLA
mmetsp:Transcript_11414/g.26337  ORF Transcript_11414/g.26337 Transcript_11414/m.26337 type:complete len:88 (-) Transcript_11414:832-1095(-)